MDGGAFRGSLTECTLLKNAFDVETATMLANVSKKKQISLCGIAAEQTEADFKDQSLQPADGILIAAVLQFRDSLTSIDVRNNPITGDGAQELAAAVLEKPSLESFSGIPLTGLRTDSLIELDLKAKHLGVTEGLVIAQYVCVSHSLTQVLAFLLAVCFSACLRPLLVCFMRRSISLTMRFVASPVPGALTLRKESRQSQTQCASAPP